MREGAIIKPLEPGYGTHCVSDLATLPKSFFPFSLLQMVGAKKVLAMLSVHSVQQSVHTTHLGILGPIRPETKGPEWMPTRSWTLEWTAALPEKPRLPDTEESLGLQKAQISKRIHACRYAHTRLYVQHNNTIS